MPRLPLLGKFLAIQAPAFLLAVALGLHLYADRRVETARAEFGARVGAQAARIGKLVADVDPRADPAAANRMLALLLADRAVLCAEVEGEGLTAGAVAAPRRLGCRSETPDETLRIPLPGAGGLSLSLGLAHAEIVEARRHMRELALALTLAGALVAGAAAAFAFRRTIGAPLARLLGAIRSAEATGEAARVEHAAQDELGAVADAFNRMQERLAADRAALAAASQRLRAVYDTTPALLFTMTFEGVIVGVSGYFLEATGYPRGEVVGQPFARFLAPASRVRLKGGLLTDLAAAGEMRDVSLTLWRRDGAEIDVLFSAAPQEAGEGRCAVCVMSDVTMLRAAERKLREMALTDPLTGLPNRAGLAERLRDMLAAMRGTDRIGAAMLIDLDNFKWVNDTYGHAVGDRVLVEATRRIRACLRAGDALARLGGDEFAILCPDLATPAEAEVIARAIIASFTRGVDLDGVAGHIGASVGIAYAQGEDIQGAELLRRADQAMYAAKEDGKGRSAVFDAAAPRALVAAASPALIENGLSEDLFRLHFQPIVDLVEMRAVGAEALLRFDGADAAASPVALIRLAEETGQIDRLGGWILEEAAISYAALAEAAGGPFRLCVNLSARQLNETLAGRVKRALAAAPNLAGHLVLEVTETAAIRRFDLACAALEEIRGFGVRVALDDFGAGYSSLSYVTRLPIDVIKLDRGYVAAFDPDTPIDAGTGKRRALARAIVTLSRGLGVDLVAEGVETLAVAEAMRTLGVRYAQGWAFAPAMPAEAAAAWFAQFQAAPPPRQETTRLSIVA